MSQRFRSRQNVVVLLISIVAVAAGGCDFLIDFIPPEVTTVTLVNDGAFPVEVTLFYDEEQDIPEALLTEAGTELNFTIPAGGVRSSMTPT
jgi:hypothetical protein